MSVTELRTEGRIAVITVDNPPVNALSHAVRAGLMDCLRDIGSDNNIDAAVLTCAGRTFIAGADIREFGKPPQQPFLPDVVLALDGFGKPLVAALHGTALGGGLEVAMGCHYRLAAGSAMVGLPEVNLGLLPGAGGTQLLPRLVGAEAALEMMLSGKPIPAQPARLAGIVDKVVVDDNLLVRAIAFANEVAKKPIPRSSERQMPPVNTALFEQRREQVAARSHGLFAPGKIIDCVEQAVSADLVSGMAFERAAFLACHASSQSAGLRHAFLAERSAVKVPNLAAATPVRDVKQIVVIGAGTMGAGIAYSCLTAGFGVRLLDKDADGIGRGEKTVRGLFEGGVARGKLSQDKADAMLAQFATDTNLANVADADLVIEAVFENMAVKKEVFANLGKHCRAGAILATNTSTLDVDAIAAASGRAKDVIGLHFFSPAHIMRLIEIVRGRNTADDVLATSAAFAKRLRKLGVVVGNCYGFVGNRMLYAYGRENQLMLLEGAPPEHIDHVLQDWGMAMGPNAVGDLAGIDVGYKARKERDDLPDDPRFYQVANLLVEQGRLGRKTGRGTFLYEDGSRTPKADPEVQQLINDEAARLGIEQRVVPDDEIIDRCIYGLVTEGARILEDGIAARAADIDVIWMNGYGFPRYRGGPMHYADSVGLDKVHARVCEFRDRFGAQYWEPPQLLTDLANSSATFADFVK
ncbi:MAG: 3-hydroxyacyl-CoA dehydrogenase [Woeseia sp.]|nr:enoyl-CoA hydratase/isomerase family protein [Woeseia sp.]NNL54409.1 3-hydroxyacyl-CoA dehydrogenase [Woeseia sp.]